MGSKPGVADPTVVPATVDDAQLQRLLHHDNVEQWRSLSYLHWPTLMAYYNISLMGRYASLSFYV